MWMIRNKTKMTLAERSRGKLVIMLVVVKEKRVSRQAREMEDLMLSLMLIITMLLTAVVEVNMSI